MVNQFLQSYAPPKPSPTAKTPAPANNGLMMSLLPKASPKPLMSVAPPPTVKEQANANPNTQNQFLNGYGTGNQFLSSMGSQAKAPEQNVPKPSMSIAPTQVKTVPNQPTGNTTQASQGTPTVNTTAQINNSAGTLNPNYNVQPGVTQGITQQPQTTATGANTQSQGQPSPYTPNSGLYGQLIAGLANNYSRPSAEYQQATQDYKGAVGNLADFNKNLATAYGNIESQPIPLEFQQGREQVLARQAASQQAALQGAVNQQQAALGFANTQQGQQQGALAAAMQAAGQTLTPGQYQPFNEANGGGFGAGLERGRVAANYSYNTNLSQDFAAQAAQLQQPMQALHTVAGQAAQFLEANGLNSNTSTLANSAINQGLKQTNPAAYATIKAVGAEAQTLIANIAGISGDLIPSDITQKAQSMSIDDMSARDILAFVQAVDAIGQARLGTLQGSASAAGGSTYQPYSGSPANTNAQLPSTPTPSTIVGGVPNTNNQLGNAAIGLGANALNLGNAAALLFGGLFNRLLGK